MYNIKLIVTILKKKCTYFPFSVPYVTIFINNFLHFLLNRCDVKLKPVLIVCSVFASLGSGFMHLPEHFLVVVVIFPWLLILSPLKKWWKLIFRDCYQVNLKILLHNLHQMSGIENLLWPLDYTDLNIYSRVCVMKLS